MIDLLEYITRQIAGIEKIFVEEQELDGQKVYTIKAPKDVMGILIGKEGRTIRAIRALARARAIKEQINIFVKLEEN